jgi:hypothetical protein
MFIERILVPNMVQPKRFWLSPPSHDERPCGQHCQPFLSGRRSHPTKPPCSDWGKWKFSCASIHVLPTSDKQLATVMHGALSMWKELAVLLLGQRHRHYRGVICLSRLYDRYAQVCLRSFILGVYTSSKSFALSRHRFSGPKLAGWLGCMQASEKVEWKDFFFSR